MIIISSSARRALMLTAAGMLLTGCYTQVPIDLTVPRAGTRVIAQLTDAGTVAMANAIGPGATTIEGFVQTANDSAWTLSLLRVDQRGGNSAEWKGEAITFPRASLTGVSEKRLDKRRSWLAGGLIAAGAILAAKLFGAFSIAEGDGGPPPPPQ